MLPPSVTFKMEPLRIISFCLRITLFLLCTTIADAQAQQSSDWRHDWSLQDSFTVEIDSRGYQYPTSIAFIPHPGKNPKDPLYFVTELRGKVKVVTNDRTVQVFAENFFQAKPDTELPSASAEFGMAGVCLDPVHGYVFVTFSYRGGDKLLYNNIVRFSTKPGTFSSKPSAQLEIKDVFSSEEAGVSHQIGNCEVVGDHLYVSVGDAQKTYPSQRLDSVLGKVLRMTLDGMPAPDNPFYEDNDIHKPQNYVFAFGLRNPFAIQGVGERIFVGDNGYRIDRFLEIEKGKNYLWNGKDLSIGTSAATVFFPAVAPVQLDYYSQGSILPQKYERSFFVAASGWNTIQGPSPGKGVLTFQYDLSLRKVVSVPEYIVQYTGSDYQAVAGVAIGKDGLYFVPLYSVHSNTGAVLKLQHKPGYIHSNRIGLSDRADVIIMEKGCLSCHSFKKERETTGPTLEQESLVSSIQTRLNSNEYRKSIRVLNEVSKEPYKSNTKARNDVLKAKDPEKVRTWLKYHLLEPKFDNPNAQMPNLGLTEEQAVAVADYLLKVKVNKKKKHKKTQNLQTVTKAPRTSMIYFGLGIVFGVLIAGFTTFVRSRRRLRRPEETKDRRE